MLLVVSSSSSVPRNFYSLSSQVINWITYVSMEAGIQYINMILLQGKLQTVRMKGIHPVGYKLLYLKGEPPVKLYKLSTKGYDMLFHAKYGSYVDTRLDYKLSFNCKLLSIQIAEVSKTSTSTNLHGCIFWYFLERSHSQDLNEIPNG